jgi:hypothetical protein
MVSALVEIPSEVGNGFDVRADRLVGIVKKEPWDAAQSQANPRLGVSPNKFYFRVVEFGWVIVRDAEPVVFLLFLCFLALGVDVVDLADMFVGAPKIKAAARAVPDRIVLRGFMISPLKEARLCRLRMKRCARN